ncbi:hypothetical protein QJQ45_007482 [Haematococcus lacustris]|nr:hypothetical protein QJQ45_007482 [Haematococcus lacustris]
MRKVRFGMPAKGNKHKSKNINPGKSARDPKSSEASTKASDQYPSGLRLMEQRMVQGVEALQHTDKDWAARLEVSEQRCAELDSARKEAETKLQAAVAQLEILRQGAHQYSVTSKTQAHQECTDWAAVDKEHARQLAAVVNILQADKLRHEEDMEVLEERMAALSAQEEAAAADLRLCKEELASAHTQLTQTRAVHGGASSSFPKDFGCVEQRECLDQLSVAVEQLVSNMNHAHPLEQLQVEDVRKAHNLVSNCDRGAAAAALHHHIMTKALGITQQQVDWYQCQAGAFIIKYLACLASCPESGRTDLQTAMQQLQQAKSSTLFLLLAVAAAMTRVTLLLASLQGSCPGLQLVSSLKDWAAPEGQRACEAPVRQLLGKVQSSRPLFLVRPGLVCPAAGGGRQVLVRQQRVELVPDPEWLEQQCQVAAEELAAAKQREADAARKVYEAAQKKRYAEYTLLRHKEEEARRHSASASGAAAPAPA